MFVDGVGGNCCPVATRAPAFWGGALDSAAAAPVRLPVPEKLVYSPHVYGPGVLKNRLFLIADMALVRQQPGACTGCSAVSLD